MTERKDIVPEGLERQYEKLQFAPAVRVGDTIHVSGVIGTRDDGSVDDDPAGQFAQAFTNLAHVLKAAGCTMDDVVEMTTFHVGLQQNMRAFMAAKRAAMTGPPHPAWTAIGIVELAIPGGLVEIRATVHAPD
jgi:enamine deaminase RidA (YjgF/YER057c/UK114 family)